MDGQTGWGVEEALLIVVLILKSTAGWRRRWWRRKRSVELELRLRRTPASPETELRGSFSSSQRPHQSSPYFSLSFSLTFSLSFTLSLSLSHSQTGLNVHPALPVRRFGRRHISQAAPMGLCQLFVGRCSQETDLRTALRLLFSIA